MKITRTLIEIVKRSNIDADINIKTSEVFTTDLYDKEIILKDLVDKCNLLAMISNESGYKDRVMGKTIDRACLIANLDYALNKIAITYKEN
ncbi:hypothetical protein CWI38_0322p0010 [Hamiltosporidium tvaerminnensis]|uniref:Uncharacterized protein n=1 Tax=Hamiltosporidium tvaerminnensis TaxID=1176355 RepID=A0A4Q9M193_9MICR|nr:hypothetical protein CWI38_0322p0010 [Hamiltosporidium tvaerminnensis]